MTDQKPPALFLQRASYRQRRLKDAARLVPILGIVLWLIPLAWPRTAGNADIGSSGVLYVFGVWVLLILLSFGLARTRPSEDGAGAADVPDR